MERANEKVIDQTELADEDLNNVTGGAFHYVRRYYYFGPEGTNDQVWTVKST